ncbi:PREDICTED: uncharacterized protein LOC109225088 [Nicotiana attenuata]|uniref:uncharacterized protein LOC109225088 n=1 Tax=Nicotiana attenuata TaxID=49451 RepID=UPI000904E500|nr:PREDICTED: uncharacterized protein LOC109225088 [Nicotiana attenuata]
MGGMVEEGLKSSKIMSYSAIKATTQAIQNGIGGMLGKKKKEDVAMVISGSWHGPREKCWHLKSAIQELIDTNQIVVQSPEAPNINQNPLPAHAKTHMIEIVYKDGEPEKPSKFVMMIRASESNSVKTPVLTNATSSTADGLTDKLSPPNVKPPVLVVKGFPDDVEAKQGKPKVVVPRIASKPVIIVEGARIDPVIIKSVTQLPINNTKVVPWNYKQVIVTYKGKEVEEEVNETRGLTRSGRCFTPEELRKAKPLKDNPIPVKKPVTEEEAEEFLRKMKVQDYSILEQLRKTPAQISLLSLLIHSDEHRRALMKILNEAHVPDKITMNHLEKIVKKIFEANRITFSDDELPLMGTEHNRALYLTVKCEDSLVSRVLVDNGSSANICPLSILQKLKINTERIHKNSICVRGFDGGGKDSVGNIVLELTIGPVECTMEFQVLDVAVSYNLLLDSPWIHVAKAVTSSLHQMVKFEWDGQEIIVHGDKNLCAYNDTYVPFIEAEDDKGPWVYQTFKMVSVEKIPEGECIPGIVQPVSLPENLGTFGLGFKPTWDEVKRAKRLKKKAWSLPKPIPRLSRSFIKPGVVKHTVSAVPKPVVDFDEELIESQSARYRVGSVKDQSYPRIATA